jgi:hypothetical protein
MKIIRPKSGSFFMPHPLLFLNRIYFNLFGYRKGCVLPSTDMSSMAAPAGGPNSAQGALLSTAPTTAAATNNQASMPIIVITDTSETKGSSETASRDNDSEIVTDFSRCYSNEKNQSQVSVPGAPAAAAAAAPVTNFTNTFDSIKFTKRRPEINETVFRINKGCKTFDFSFEKNILITGGKLCNRLR